MSYDNDPVRCCHVHTHTLHSKLKRSILVDWANLSQCLFALYLFVLKMVVAFDFVSLSHSYFSSLSNGEIFCLDRQNRIPFKVDKRIILHIVSSVDMTTFVLRSLQNDRHVFQHIFTKNFYANLDTYTMPQLRTTITPNYYTACQIGFVPSVPYSHAHACVDLSLSKAFLISVYNLLHIFFLCFAPPFFWLAFVAIAANPFTETRTASRFVIHMFHSIQNVFMFQIYLAFANSENNILLAKNMQNWIFPLLAMPLPPLLRSAAGKKCKEFLWWGSKQHDWIM